MTIDIKLAKSITIAYEALQECLRIDDARGIRVWARVLRRLLEDLESQQ